MSPSLPTRTCWLVALALFASLSSLAGPLEERAMRLLNDNCLSCHNAEKHRGGLQLASRDLALKGGDSGPALHALPEQSLLFKVLAPDAEPHMPPKKQLNTNQIEILRQWITAGAQWDLPALAKASAPREVKFENLPPGYQPVLAVALSPESTRLAIARADRLILHDLSATNFPALVQTNAHPDLIRSLAWNSDGTLLASGSFREVALWNPATLEKKWSRTNLADRISALRFTPYGGALLLADSPPSRPSWLRMLAPADGTLLAEWEAHSDAINDLTVSPDGGLLASSGSDKVIKLWELASRREIGQYEGHTASVYGGSFNSNATELVTVSADHHLRVWDVRTRHSVVTIGPKPRSFNAVAWASGAGTVFAVDEAGALLRLSNFKRHTGEQSSSTADERQIANWSQPLLSVTVNHDASRVIAGAQDGTVYMVNSDGKLLHTFAPPPSELPMPADVPSFARDVLPLLAKSGCSAGGCHAKPEGQNGFRLSVFSYDPKADFEEITREAHARRIFPAAPDESLLLLKPTMAVEHGGGQRLERDSDTYRTIVRWIRGGMPFQLTNEPSLVRISVQPLEGSYSKGASTNLTVLAHFSDGSQRDVTPLADYISNEKEIARVDDQGRVHVGQLAGESIIVARYMGFVDAARFTVPAEQALPDDAFAALPVHNFVDRIAYENFRKLGLYPSALSSDSEFLRRVTLDVIGRLPASEEVRLFVADTDPGKRSKWIDHLLRHPAYADYWANKWADLLRPNPDRVGIKSVYTLDQWLRESFRANKPYDQFVREIILAEGHNHRHGPIVVYRDRREPPELTTMFSQLFLGVRMECAKCHHHPNEKWSQDDFYQLAAFFGAVKQKGAGLSPPISAGNETFYFAEGGAVRHPVTQAVMKPKPLDADLPLAEKEDPRRALADWMTNPSNPFFARAAVNRVWASFFGRGFVEPVDDFRISNPAVHEPLLNALAADFASHGYDLKHLIRTIANSRLYQLSSTPAAQNLADTRNYSRSYRRRLPAEVLLDAVNDIVGVPTQFDGCPPGTRAIQTWSYKIDSHFMDAFGRPNSSSDAPCERDLRTSVIQALHMMNSRELQDKLSHADGNVKRLVDSARTNDEIVDELYLSTLSRLPTNDERSLALTAFAAPNASRQTATEDVLWALLNSAEFVFNH